MAMIFSDSKPKLTERCGERCGERSRTAESNCVVKVKAFILVPDYQLSLNKPLFE